ncbi:MAG: hypothetical protein RSA79_04890 [Oscillospiraceae bacterium]
MPSIIEQIVEIDSVAQQRLDEANKIKIDIQNEVDKTSKKTKLSLEQKAKETIEKVQEIENQFANQEIDKILKDNNVSLSRIEKYYQDNHKSIEDKVFNNIISSN